MVKSLRPLEDRVRYRQHDDIFMVNLSGRIDERNLADISRALRDCMRSIVSGDRTVKFLFDFRNVQWDSETTHRKARGISAGYLQEFRHLTYFSAILNNDREGQSFENEFFFTQEQAALNWLKGK